MVLKSVPVMVLNALPRLQQNLFMYESKDNEILSSFQSIEMFPGLAMSEGTTKKISDFQEGTLPFSCELNLLNLLDLLIIFLFLHLLPCNCHNKMPCTGPFVLSFPTLFGLHKNNNYYFVADVWGWLQTNMSWLFFKARKKKHHFGKVRGIAS